MSIFGTNLNFRLDLRKCCPSRQQCAIWLKQKHVLELLIPCCMLYWSSWAFPLAHVNQPKVPQWNLGDFLKLKVEERVNYINQRAPEGTHDSSVPLNEVAHDELHLNLSFSLLFGMNGTVAPCQDFYEFACGHSGYGKISDGPYISTRSMLRSTVKDMLTGWNFENSHPRPMNLAAEFYSQCHDEYGDRIKSVHKMLNSLGGWPTIDPSWTERKFDVLNMIAKGRRLYDHHPFFCLFVYFHPKNRTRNVLYLGLPTLSEKAGAGVSSQTAANSYGAYVEFICELSELSSCSHQRDAHEVRRLERKLSMAATVDKDPQSYDIMTLEQFQIEMDKVNVNTYHAKVNWTALLNEIFRTSGVIAKSDQEIVVGDISYMKKLLAILDTTPLRTLANYIQWSLLRRWLPRVPNTYRAAASYANLSPDLDIAEDHTSTEVDLKHRCLTETMEKFAIALSNEFVKRLIFSPSNRAAVNNMATTIRQSYKVIIRESGWINDAAKLKALEKVEGMGQFVGYPDWVANDTWIEELFGTLRLGRDSVDSRFNIMHWNSDRLFRSLEWDMAAVADVWSLPAEDTAKTVHDTDSSTVFPGRGISTESAQPQNFRFISPFDVNAYHLRKVNSFVIPMGITFNPFYFPTGPASVNFGKLGRIIGHEISHSFDSDGIKYDSQGLEKEWLGPEDKEKFDQNAKCFVEQYNRYEVVPGKRINGTLTLDENIADNVGLHVALRAYKRLLQDGQLELPKKLLGLEKLSSEQIFFLSYASSLCEPVDASTLEWRLRNDNHSPSRYRVIGSLQNCKEFAQAYQCPLGTPMNPEAKCDLW